MIGPTSRGAADSYGRMVEFDCYGAMLIPESYVELQEIPVLRVRADMTGEGPSAAFALIESKLPTLKGRKFYGTFRDTPEGEESYACVARVNSDDPRRMELEPELSPAAGTPVASCWTGKTTSHSCPSSSPKWPEPWKRTPAARRSNSTEAIPNSTFSSRSQRADAQGSDLPMDRMSTAF